MDKTWLTILTAVLTGGFLVSLVNLVRDIIMWKKNRKATLEDREDQQYGERLKVVEEQVAKLIQSQKYMLYDRIRYVGQSYIKDGEIDFDDRRILSEMHYVYHNILGGNGDLDTLMKEVNSLPLIVK